MKRTVIAAALAASSLAHAGEPLNAKEWALEGAFLAAGLVDYGQTRDLVKNRLHDMHEQNALLGRNPSEARVRNYFMAMGAAHVVVSHALPRGAYRATWQWSTLALQLAVIARNKQIGLKVDF